MCGNIVCVATWPRHTWLAYAVKICLDRLIQGTELSKNKLETSLSVTPFYFVLLWQHSSPSWGTITIVCNCLCNNRNCREITAVYIVNGVATCDDVYLTWKCKKKVIYNDCPFWFLLQAVGFVDTFNFEPGDVGSIPSLCLFVLSSSLDSEHDAN